MGTTTAREVFAFSGFSLDARQRLLFGADGEPIALSARAFDTLLYFVEHPGELIDKQTLLKALWPNQVVEENNLNQNISIVRRALGEAPGEHRFIVTIPGRGFRFVAQVRDEPLEQVPVEAVREPEGKTESSTSSSAVPPGSGRREEPSREATEPASVRRQPGPTKSRTLGLALGGLGVVAVASWSFWLSRPHEVDEHHRTSVSALESTAAITSVPTASVAVMPFANLTGDASKEYFSDGMAEQLINELTRVPGLKVPARSSSFAYKGRNVDARQIARDLGVATILEGSVRSAGERIRVTAELVNAQSGFHLWSQSYDRDFGDIFQLEDQISAQIVTALKSAMQAQLTVTGIARPPPTKDPEAFRLYLQAKAAIPEQALTLNAEALRRDPQFAQPWAESALDRIALALLVTDDSNAVAQAEHEANQALALDPELPEAHLALGATSAWRGQWVAAERSFRRALVLDSNNAFAHFSYEIFLLNSVGHMRRGFDEARRAYELAPADGRVITDLSLMYLLLGMDAEAVKYATLASKLGAPHPVLLSVVYAESARRSGHYETAAAYSFQTLSPVLRQVLDADDVKRVYVAFGNPAGRAQALLTVKSAFRRVSPGQVTAPLSWWFVLLGDLDGAYDLLNQLTGESAPPGTLGTTTTWGFLWAPEMRPFRQDPRFVSLARRMKLFDYWKEYGPPDACDVVQESLVCR